MAHSNNLISFLRHCGPIPTSDNMYDELIQSEIERHAIDPAIHIDPARLEEVRCNFESGNPNNVILTGTAGDGKTYHCRRIWEHFGGDTEEWKAGEKIVELSLPESGKKITIVKDLSELTQSEKNRTIENLAMAVAGKNQSDVFLVAANDGQLLAAWRDWSIAQDEEAYRDFKIVEDMLIEERTGTIPVPLVVGMGVAAKCFFEEDAVVERSRIAALRDRLIDGLRSKGVSIEVNTPLGQPHHPGNANIRFVGIEAHELLQSTQPFLGASTGSACTSGMLQSSHVLRAIGLTECEASQSVRFSIGRPTTLEDVDAAVTLLAKTVEDLEAI